MTCKVISSTKSQNFAFDDLGAQGHTEGLKGNINSAVLLLTSPVCHAVYTKAVIIFYCGWDLRSLITVGAQALALLPSKTSTESPLQEIFSASARSLLKEWYHDTIHGSAEDACAV